VLGGEITVEGNVNDEKGSGACVYANNGTVKVLGNVTLNISDCGFDVMVPYGVAVIVTNSAKVTVEGMITGITKSRSLFPF